MIHAYNPASRTRALSCVLEPRLHRLLADRITNLPAELAEWTEHLVVEPGDTEDDIIRHIGLSPLVEPVDGARFGDTSAFEPHWDWLSAHDGVWELIFTFGSTFAYILLVPDADGVLPELRRLCRLYAAA